ncbi:hypothetical protein [Mastigocoleus testarum]|uniref:Uncharacterized protein n=1 Tax=Mastigocoleus testarum BC008 TaxID=371196 RepID=A0A0V7ZIB6_9CYAN|nr:hypothetical protein [Mastigocoleus testarum]KST64253.1 hypothetical protein BC008_16565 [Mastigocoleus testarum BC008]
MTWQNYFWQNEDECPSQLSSADIVLRQQLESSLGKFFFEKCDDTVKDLLSSCRWYMKNNANAMTLVIECPNHNTNWLILEKVAPMASLLKNMTSSAKIRICPPDSKITPHEIGVDEVSVYRYW